MPAVYVYTVLLQYLLRRLAAGALQDALCSKSIQRHRHTMKRTKRGVEQPPAPIEFPRADPVALAKFDMATKVCTMNCGPHRLDPRTDKERRFLCGDCLIVERNKDGK